MTNAVETGETSAEVQFCEYPVTLTHPDYQPACWDEKNILLKTEHERFPPKIANDEGEEKALAEKGYRRVGEPDGAAFERAVRRLAGEPVLYTPDAFPMYVAEKEKIVQSAEEYEKLMGVPYQASDTAEPMSDDLLASAATEKPARPARAEGR